MHLSGHPSDDLPGRLASALSRSGADACDLGVAVSGGSDSVALLLLLRDYLADGGGALHAVTLDHGLRAGAALEAAQVAELCARLDIPHDILRWTGVQQARAGNLQDRARRARYGLIAGWARERGLARVALGHTMDDQGETVLMRLARGAGATGLSGMAETRRVQGVTFLRPLLHARRAELRAFLRARGVGWADDPSNDDPGFERVRARAVMAALDPLGIDAETLARVACNLRDADRVVTAHLRAQVPAAVTQRDGVLLLDRAALAALDPEILRRIVVASLTWLASTAYAPRRAAVAQLCAALLEGRGATLHGCRLLQTGRCAVLCREYRAVAATTCAPDAAWDSCWHVSGPTASGQRVAALGTEGLAQCPNWRGVGLPRAALLAMPGIWQHDRLIAAPLAGWPQGWSLRRMPAEPSYFGAA